MATSPTLLPDGIAHLATLAAADLDALWRQVTTAVQARDALKDILPSLIDTYGAAAGTLAADYYDELRARNGVPGNFGAVVADLPDPNVDALAGWAVDPLFAKTPDWAAAVARVDGGVQRRVADIARNTIAHSSIQDPRAQGWVRVGRGDCAWCAQHIDGVVHYVEGYDYKAHDHCQCSVEPAF